MANSPDNVIPLAVTIGEPAGIGADVILKAWDNALKSTQKALPFFILLCDPDQLTERAHALGVDVTLEEHDFAAATSPPEKLQYLPLKNRFQGKPGRSVISDAGGVVEAISTAVDLTCDGKTRGIVTLPINKKSLYDSGFDYPGHTEFLGALAQEHSASGESVMPVMMLAGPDLRAVPVTIHIPLKDVPSALTVDLIVETTTITAHDLQTRFNIARPRIAISGLNPHAGENGAMGEEDEAIIMPAVEQLKRSGIDCFGPLPADTMFHPAARARYDAAVCMYHDQALIPAKALAFDDTVNVTLGLPFVRTSPDHGTAYDIAGTGKANPASTIAALRLADVMTQNTST